jgi:predicted Zn finger-like uncharacterized protein
MKFVCDRCQTRYSIADEKIGEQILRIRCKTCNNVITVQAGAVVPGPQDSPKRREPVAGSPSAARPSSKLSLPPPRPHKWWSDPRLPPPVSGSGPKLAPPPVPGSGPKAAPQPVSGSGPKLAPPPVPGSGPKAAPQPVSGSGPKAAPSGPGPGAKPAPAGGFGWEQARQRVAAFETPPGGLSLKQGPALPGLTPSSPGPPSPSAPPGLEAELDRVLAPRLEKRPSRAQSVAALGTHLPKSARPTVAQRHRHLKYVVAAGVVGVLVGFVVSFSWRGEGGKATTATPVLEGAAHAPQAPSLREVETPPQAPSLREVETPPQAEAEVAAEVAPKAPTTARSASKRSSIVRSAGRSRKAAAVGEDPFEGPSRSSRVVDPFEGPSRSSRSVRKSIAEAHAASRS